MESLFQLITKNHFRKLYMFFMNLINKHKNFGFSTRSRDPLASKLNPLLLGQTHAAHVNQMMIEFHDIQARNKKTNLTYNQNEQ